MADGKQTKSEIRRQNKVNRNITGNINGMLSQISTIAFGAPKNRDIEELNSQFDDLMQSESDGFNRSGNRDDTSTFISNLFKDSPKQTDVDFMTQLNNIFDDNTNEGSIRSFIDEAYKNRLLKQSDLHEIASQLIELREAILICRDAIISSDIVEGAMTRNIKFSENGSTSMTDLISTVESMEDKFKLQNKIKNFIVPKTLEFGEYYAYIIPYAKLFSDFMKRKEDKKFGYDMYRESTLYDVVQSKSDVKTSFKSEVRDMFESVHISRKSKDSLLPPKVRLSKEDDAKFFSESIDKMMKNIVVCNDPMPLNVLEEGVGSIEYFSESYVDQYTFQEKPERVGDIGSDSFFNRVIKSSSDGDGVYNTTSKSFEKGKKKTERDFDNIHDCYLKIISPTHMVPVQIMNKTIGYYYVTAEDAPAANIGATTSSMYYNRFEENRRESTVIDAIARKIVMSFDKKFLEDNIKFKDLIVDALNYYNVNTQRVRFQYIPAEYVVVFKVSEDENGNGTSILEPSLFYAKLYLMLLLFKMMSIILYSNDSRINYIRTSGIDTNVRKKIEEIARTKQQRQITVMDLFSYTSLVNKLGVGAETYIPTGRSNERGMETEVIQGQDVQLNNDFMDMLRKAYILGTGVPDAIMNYMNEADFAKSLELANSRFLGRVVSYQIDFNEGITEMYKRLMRWSTTIDPSVIDTFEFSFSAPKTQSGQIKADMINNFDTFATWVIGLLVGQQNMDSPEYEPIVREMKKLLVEDNLPIVKLEKIEKMFRGANINGIEKMLIPKGKEQVSDDIDLSGL